MDTIEADYVIVGAGSAGCVLAARLSEDPNCRVVVLEAGGPDRNIWIHIPIGYGKTIVNPAVNWMYQTEPEAGVNNRSVFWPRGKVLGGSSSINGLLYVRGQAEDYDHWRQLGNTGWSYDDVLPYFKRSEGRVGSDPDGLHGHDGALTVTDFTDPNPLAQAYVEAAQLAGIPFNPDYNGRYQDGVCWYQTTIRNGRRCSAARAFLHPAMKRKNLRVITNAQAERVLLAGRRAVGVAFRHKGESVTVRAAREVILCGGAINSPQLLMLSGIGPAAHLADCGIEVAHDLPGVGQNLQDHFNIRMVYKATQPLTINDIMMSPRRMAMMGLQYLLTRSGPLTASAGQVGIFTRTRPELATPDVQFHFIGFSADRPAEGLHKFSGFTQHVCQLRPESRGTITLKSSDQLAAPAIHANYLATELDRATMLAGLQLGRRIAEQAPMAAMIESEYLPGAHVQSDADMMNYIRGYGATVYHPVGTAKMGQDRMAVVDDQLRLHGIGGLRVADASVMPTLVSGNTNAACIMIGEKCADLIRGQTLARAA
ncbi:MAG: choline dehydrogenase [Acetobacteraceae bacterium]|nr:choline dehydrogenase [Acetobacteraceae bacterium]